jgi:hypothetical protein
VLARGIKEGEPRDTVAAWSKAENPSDLKEMRGDGKMALRIPCPAAGTSSFKGGCYSDNVGIYCPQCGWSNLLEFD